MELLAFISILLGTLVNSVIAGVADGDTMMDYLSSKPELSCAATGRNIEEDFVILKCPATCTGGVAHGGELVSGSRKYHSWSHICFAALHAGILADTNGWFGLRKEKVLGSYPVVTAGPHTTEPMNFKEGDEEGWTITLISIADAKRTLRVGHKVSCTDVASAFLVESDYFTVECPPGCYVTAEMEFFKLHDGSVSADDKICPAAINKGRITVTGGFVRYFAYQLKVGNRIKFADLSYDCLNATRNNVAIDAAQEDGSGVHWVCVDSPRTCYKTYCDNSLPSGTGWMTIQRRVNSTMDFYRGWNSYEYGFGDPAKQFWFGLSPIRDFVVRGSYELNITMKDKMGNTKYAHYDTFSIGPAIKDYPLYVSGYSGTAGDSLSCSNLAPFSTYDHNSGVYAQLECPKKLRGGWWYTDCGESNLNGEFINLGSTTNYQTAVPQLYWYSWMFPMEFVEMKIRKKTG